MRQRLEDKNRMIEQKTQAAMQAQQERNRMSTELTELKDHMDIKDKKINVLLRKVSALGYYPLAILREHPTSDRGSNLKLTLCWAGRTITDGGLKDCIQRVNSYQLGSLFLRSN